MRIADRVAKDNRLSWKRKGGIVLATFLERVGTEHTVARLLELTQLADSDVLNQLRRFAKAGVLSRRTDLEVFPAEDHFWLTQERVLCARARLQQADDGDFRELAGERGLDIDRALGDFSTQQPYPVALGKALRDARIAFGWSQAEVATEVPSVSGPRLSQVENGHALPTLIVLAELALLYTVDPVDLLVRAACHSKPDKQVQALKIAEPTFRAVLTHKFAERRFRELARTKPHQHK
ncbi:helix-turn-helix domain-containing protein [Lentzea aerocolonigenes]|uniref:helix-turn-helix domain-containing protein n=1 Tax=Lentzea aerocolonigenes TaxID=68170 RepID=UPI0004C36C3E|nr:helix-turn-helix transcriptional regulator [Lentzea aerocolonigenes]MCP2243329.1 Helix-turn-helix domain-containing protein [Lentzea aerocolonigenes]